MLIKVTNHCAAGCSHCMEDSTVAGKHMPIETFERALSFSLDVETLARRVTGLPTSILLSGGECSGHPAFEELIERVERRGMVPVLITNGQWLADRALRERVLRPGRPIFVSVTSDPRFYPTPVTLDFADERVMIRHQVGSLLPLGRAARRSLPDDQPLKGPISFNLRSVARTTGDIRQAIAWLRVRSMTHGAGACTPSISDDGRVHAGDSRNCFSIGTLDSSYAELTQALIDMQCNRCGLVGRLTKEQRAAIGEVSAADTRVLA